MTIIFSSYTFKLTVWTSTMIQGKVLDETVLPWKTIAKLVVFLLTIWYFQPIFCRPFRHGALHNWMHCELYNCLYILQGGGGCLWNCITFVCTFFLDQESLQHLKTLIYAGKVHQLKASSISRHKLNYFKCTLITQNKHGTFYYCRLCIEHRLR